MKKAYCVNLVFGTWHNQMWLSGDEEDEAVFARARLTHENAVEGAANPNEFFGRTVEHFESYGFKRIQK